MFNSKKRRIAELLAQNAALWDDQKRDLKRIHKLCEELKGLQKEYYKLESIYQPLSCDVETLRDENRQLKKARECPEDCAHRANPGPGGSICRNCKRNPNAKDKYIKTEEAKQ